MPQENNISPNEIEQLREQMNLLQQLLNKKTEISERQLRRAVAGRVSKLVHLDLMGLVICFAVIPLLWYSVKMQGCGRVFQGFILFSFTINAIMQLVQYNRSRRNAMLLYDPNTDLVALAKSLREYKRKNDYMLYRIGIPFLVVFVIFYAYELYRINYGDGLLDLTLIVVGLMIGAVIGGLIGYLAFQKPLANNVNRALQDIADACDEAAA